MNRREFIAGLATLAVLPKEVAAKSLHGPLKEGALVTPFCHNTMIFGSAGWPGFRGAQPPLRINNGETAQHTYMNAGVYEITVNGRWSGTVHVRPKLPQ